MKLLPHVISAPLVLAASWLLCPNNLMAGEGFRCRNNRIVELGDLTVQVIDKCGPPTNQIVRRGRWGQDEVWMYDNGPLEFVRILEFDTRGVLINLTLGDYGRQR